MRVAPSTYYAARTRALSARSVRDEALMRVMRQVWKENYCVFGVRKMGLSVTNVVLKFRV